MNQNDVVQRKELIVKGTPLAHNFPSIEGVKNFMEHDFKKQVRYRIGDDPLNPGAFSPITEEDYEEVYEGKVNWVMDKSVSITIRDRTFITEDFEGEGWKVIQEAPILSQTPQELASTMSVEELRANIERLRGMRAKPIKQAKERVVATDALSIALGKLTPEQLIKVKAKLGLS